MARVAGVLHGDSRVPAGHDRLSDVVERYLELGLRLGRHVDGFVDAYYGPPELAARVDAEPLRAPAELAADAGRLVAGLDAGVDADQIDAGRRRWIRAQALGLRTGAAKLAGEPIGYLDEVERCYGARPALVAEDDFAAAHARLDAVLPGEGALRERYIAWREAHAVPREKLEPAIRSLADDLRERTQRLFGLPEGEHVEWIFETDKPWSGFNYYEGGLRSRVAINVDRPEPIVAEHLAPLGVRYDAEVAAAVAEAGETLSWVRSNAAILLHDEGKPADDVIAYLERWALLPRARAEKAMAFMTDPTWRAYTHTYTEGLRLCRGHVDGDPARFEQLITEQMLPG